MMMIDETHFEKKDELAYAHVIKYHKRESDSRIDKRINNQGGLIERLRTVNSFVWGR
jgi:hypothetical protein